MTNKIPLSTTNKYIDIMKAKIHTTKVVIEASFLDGHTTCDISFFTSLKKVTHLWNKDPLFFTFIVKPLKMAGVVGFEPTTFGFGDRRSTN